MKNLEKTFETYFLTKAPKIPADIVKLIVQYGPYLLALMLVFGAMSVLSVFGLNALVFEPVRMYMGPGLGAWYQVYLIFTIVILVLQGLALPGLLKRQMAGWRYLYYAALVALIMNIVTFNIPGLIVGSGLSLYILFQIRSQYT